MKPSIWLNWNCRQVLVLCLIYDESLSKQSNMTPYYLPILKNPPVPSCCSKKFTGELGILQRHLKHLFTWVHSVVSARSGGTSLHTHERWCPQVHLYCPAKKPGQSFFRAIFQGSAAKLSSTAALTFFYIPLPPPFSDPLGQVYVGFTSPTTGFFLCSFDLPRLQEQGVVAYPQVFPLL